MVLLKRIRFKVYFSCQKAHETELIQKSLSFQHPDPYNVPSYNERLPNGKRKWDGIIRHYNDNRTFNIGLLHYVVDALLENNCKYELLGFEVQDYSNIHFSEPIEADNRDYQRDAVMAALQRCIGITKVPTRGGKTYIAGEKLRILAELGCEGNYLFITDSTDALKQLPADLLPFVGKFCNKIGIIEGDHRDFTRKVTIGMVQTIQGAFRRPENKRTEKDKAMLKYLGSVTVLMIDEIHEYSTAERLKMIKYIVWRKLSKIQHFYSYSATPYKKSHFVESLQLEKYTGGIIYDITQSELEDRKVLAKSKILLVINEVDPEQIWDDNYRDLQKSIIHNSAERTWLLYTIIEVCICMNLKTLVMFSSKVHGYKVSDETGLTFISGDSKIDERLSTKTWFLAGEGNVLLVSEIWKKAITLPDVEVFVNASGGKEDTLITQKKGRVLGVTDTKKRAAIIDIIDIYEDYFSEHSLSRIEAYQETNSDDDIDTMENTVDFKENLIKYLQEWFQK